MAVGFGVSFIGSVPLGYLNVAGYELYKRKGLEPLGLYILGVVAIEAIVIYLTLLFAERLSRRQRLIRAIKLFSIVFMFVLAAVFFWGKHGDGESFFLQYFDRPAFWIGLTLSAMNFMQLPFWTAWNLYVVNGGHISTHSASLKLLYVFGTLMGSAAGIALIAVGLVHAGNSSRFISDHVMPYLFPIAFLLIGLWQSLQYYREYGLRA